MTQQRFVTISIRFECFYFPFVYLCADMLEHPAEKRSQLVASQAAHSARVTHLALVQLFGS